MKSQALKTLAALLLLLGEVDPSRAAVPSAHPRNPVVGKATSKALVYASDIAPLLERYCYGCHGNGKHKGDLSLDSHTNEFAQLSDQKTWERVLKMVADGEMPPASKPQPSPGERELIARWIEREVFHCDCDHPDPGRVTIRRLNRAEYNNTVRDLLGVEFRPAEDFPVDDSGYGFDTIGDALSMPPVLLEKYLNAAQKILDAALSPQATPIRLTNHFSVDLLELGYNAKQRGDGTVSLNSVEEDDVAVRLETPLRSRYRMRVKAHARQETNRPIELTFLIDSTPVKTVTVTTNSNLPEVYETSVLIPPGKHRLRAAVRRIKDGLSESEALDWKKGPLQKGAVFVEYMELDGPLPDPTSRVAFQLPNASSGHDAKVARAFLDRFVERAFRRPITKAESDRLLHLVQSAWNRGESFQNGLRLGLEATLISPHFLFRGELQPAPDNPARIHPVDEFALASRLSYFLWSSMPDDELFREAERGTLRRHLRAQVQRMLASPKSGAFVSNFAGQWLQIRSLELASPDHDLFRLFDESLRTAMRKETELLFESILRDDRSVLEFLTADYTFVNERLARHYGIENIQGDRFQRVSLQGTPRKGVLTHGSVLTVTSNPTRTSPVKRGKWVLDNLLNSPPPPPPPNVPELVENKEKGLSGTLRERMVQHRANPNCISCHERMDPIGFGLENFDPIGKWRDKDGKLPIDSTGELSSGESFANARELLDILSRKKGHQFVRALSEKLLIYALGRGLEFSDRCAVDRIVANNARDDFRFSALLLEIIESTPFHMRRGETPAVSPVNSSSATASNARE